MHVSDYDSNDSESQGDEGANLYFIPNDKEKEEIVEFSRYYKLVLKEANGSLSQWVKSLFAEMSRDDSIEIVTYGVETKGKYLSKI